MLTEISVDINDLIVTANAKRFKGSMPQRLSSRILEAKIGLVLEDTSLVYRYGTTIAYGL